LVGLAGRRAALPGPNPGVQAMLHHHPMSKNCYKGPQNEPKVKLSHALRGGEDKYHHTHDNQEQK